MGGGIKYIAPAIIILPWHQVLANVPHFPGGPGNLRPGKKTLCPLVFKFKGWTGAMDNLGTQKLKGKQEFHEFYNVGVQVKNLTAVYYNGHTNRRHI